MPISLFEQGDRALIEQWYKEHDQSPDDMIATNEAKVIFLGDGGVGKTYTIRRLLTDGLQEDETDEKSVAFFHTDTTHGIFIEEQDTVTEENQPIKLHYWDFGGQTIMHSMHRVFLTEDTVYVIMLSGRDDRVQMEQASYWLRTVESFAPKAPILLLVNLREQDCHQLAQKTLCERFPALRENLSIHDFDAKLCGPETILSFRRLIVDRARHLDCYIHEVPQYWETIRQRIFHQHREKGAFIITQEEYLTICRDHMPENTPETVYEALLERFKILGVCFSYHRDSQKKTIPGYKVLNPEWLTNAIYLIIHKGQFNAEKHHGILTMDQIEGFLTNPKEGESGSKEFLSGVTYEKEHCQYILTIMYQHKLAYRLNSWEVFIPALCPIDPPVGTRPENWDDTDTDGKHIQYALEYRYLPDNVIHQLMVVWKKQHMIIEKCWKRGMWIDYAPLELTAIVNAGGGDDVLRIDVYAKGKNLPWPLLQALRTAIREIDEPMGLASPTDYIITPDGKVTVDELLIAREDGDKYYRIRGKRYKIDDLLGDSFGCDDNAIEEAVRQIKTGRISTKEYSALLSAITAPNSPIPMSLVVSHVDTLIVEQVETVTLPCDFQQLFETMERRLDLVTDDLLCAIGDLMYDNMDRAVRRIGEQLRDTTTPKTKRFENARGLMGDVADLIGIGGALQNSWTDISAAVSTHAHALYTLLQTGLP